jgi:replicative DNA helicase
LQIVREKHFLRCLISTAVSTVEKAHSHSDDIQRLLENVEQAFFKISEDRVSDSAVKIDKPIDEAMEMVQRIIRDGRAVQGIPSGFTQLDHLTFGFQGGQMVIVAARPGMGKTSIALNFIEAALFPKPNSNKAPANVLLFSLEMPARELALRLLCSRARVNMQKLRSAHPDHQTQVDLVTAANEYRGLPLTVDDNGGQTILEIRAKCRRMHAQRKLDLIVIDYIQLINGLDSSLPREQQIAEVSRSIKAMAKEFNVPVIALAQLNRKSEDEARQPRMSDLRESGSIEQDADIVMLISKLSASQSKAAGEGEAEMSDGSGCYLRQLIVAKNRNGPTHDINLLWNPGLTRFDTPARETPRDE